MPSSGDCTRVRVKHGIYRQTNGKYAVGVMVGGRPRFRTLEAVTLRDARKQREQLVDYADAVRGLRIFCAEHGRVQLVRDPPRGRSPADCCMRERAQLSPAPSRAGLLVLCAESDCAPCFRAATCICFC